MPTDVAQHPGRFIVGLGTTIVLGVTAIVVVVVRIYPAPPPGKSAPTFSQRIWYVAGDSGKPEMWTDDGVNFYIGDELFLHRVGDELYSTDGQALLRVTMNGRWLREVGGDGPGEVEENYYNSVMHR